MLVARAFEVDRNRDSRLKNPCEPRWFGDGERRSATPSDQCPDDRSLVGGCKITNGLSKLLEVERFAEHEIHLEGEFASVA
jgi:hypothetical protein